MKNKRLFQRTVIVTALTLSTVIFTSGCGNQEETVMSESVVETEPVEEETEEVIEETEEVTEETEESEADISETEETEEVVYTITETDKEMQATENAKTYEKPDGITEVSEVQQDEVVKVTGIVDGSEWYQIEQSDNTKSFIDGTFLKDIEQPKPKQQKTKQQKPKQEVQQPQEQPQQQEQQQPEVQQPEVQQPEVQQPEVQQPEVQQPEVETPQENPQPPAELPPGAYRSDDGEMIFLPDGGVIFPDGTEVHPGDPIGNGIYAGHFEDL